MKPEDFEGRRIISRYPCGYGGYILKKMPAQPERWVWEYDQTYGMCADPPIIDDLLKDDPDVHMQVEDLSKSREKISFGATKYPFLEKDLEFFT